MDKETIVPLNMSKILLHVLCNTNSVVPNQMAHFATSDLGLHSLQMPICPRVIKVFTFSPLTNTLLKRTKIRQSNPNLCTLMRQFFEHLQSMFGTVIKKKAKFFI